MRNLYVICLTLFTAVLANAQTIPTGFQEYFVVGHEQHVMNFFAAVAAGEGQGCNQNLPNNMASVVGLAASTDNQIVYYDQWEDGYETNMLSPSQPTTLILGDGNPSNGDARNFSKDPRLTGDMILRGTVLTFNSDQASGNIQNQVVPIPRVASDIRYDGGDRIFTSGGPVTLIHAEHPNQCNYIGSSMEILSRQAVGNAYSYSVPVGTNTYTRYGGDNTAGEPFKYVFIDLIAFDDDTDVFIDNKGGGTASFRLQRGEHYSSQGLINTTAAPAVVILEGTKISTSKPIAGMVYTAGSGTYQDRPFALLPDLMHSTDFVVPAPGDDPNVNGNHPLNLYIYNPDSVNTISVTGTDLTGTATFTVPPNSVRAYSEAVAMNRYVPANSAARLSSSSNFWGFAAYDHQGTTVDWGHSWLATRFLTNTYSVSWSPGTSDPAGSFAGRPATCATVGCDSFNRSPLFITAVQNNTRVQIDLNNDGVYDAVDTDSNDLPNAAPLPNNTYVLNALQSLRVYDQTDYDNTGTQIMANKNVVVSYGQDTEQGVDGDPSLDLGHMVYPLDQHWLDAVFTIDKTSDPNFVPLTGGDVHYTLTIQTYEFGPLTGISVYDLLPSGGTYVTGSTIITYPGGSQSFLDPVIAGNKITWAAPVLSPDSMNAGATLTIQYTVGFSASATPRTLRNEAHASGSFGAGSNFSPIAIHDVQQTAIQITTTSLPAIVNSGQTLTYSITVTNGGTLAESGVTVTDVLPYGVTFVPGSITSNNGNFIGSFSNSQNAVVWSAASFGSGTSATLTFQVTVNADIPGGSVIKNNATYESTQTPNLLASASSTVAAPDVSYSKSGPSVAAPNDTLFYSVTISNTGGSAATNLLITDVIPANSSYVAGSMDYRVNNGTFAALTDASDGDAGTKQTSSVEFRLASIPAGTTITFRFRVIAVVPAPPGYVNNVATVTTSQSGTHDTNLVQTQVESASFITPPPLVNSPIFQGDTSISGTSLSPNGTVIRVYRNGVYVGTATVSGGTWTLSGVSGLVAGDLITADATESGKSTSNLSPPVVVSALGLQTPPPHVNGPLYQGDTMINGTSASPDGTIINVYVNGVFVGQTTVSGNIWSLAGVNPALATGEIVSATAQEPGKGTSQQSNIVPVQAPLSIVKRSSANGGDVVPGQTLTYTVNITNTSAVNWTGITVTDNVPAGTTYVAASSTVTTPTDVVITNRYRDELTNQAYNGNNGTLNWSSSWCESGDGGGCGNPTAGDVDVELDQGDFSIHMQQANNSIRRTANLSGYTSATLSFDYRRVAMEATKIVTLDVSTDGGTTWQTPALATYPGSGGTDAGYLTASIDISGYISASTAIRFSTSANMNNQDDFFIDNVQIQVSKTVRQIVTTAACAPPTLIGPGGCTGYTLMPGETMIVNYQVTVNNPPGTTAITNTAAFSATQNPGGGSSTVTDYVSGFPDVLRNDQTTSLASYNPASIFVRMYPSRPAMDPFGPDYWPQEGEGALTSGNGSSDDDDFYKLAIPNIWLDPDTTVLGDASRPLVFYEVTCSGCTIHLSKQGGQIQISY